MESSTRKCLKTMDFILFSYYYSKFYIISFKLLHIISSVPVDQHMDPWPDYTQTPVDPRKDPCPSIHYSMVAAKNYIAGIYVWL